MKRKQLYRWLLLAMLIVGAAVVVKAWHDTTAEPLVRTTQLTMAGLDPSTPPQRIVLISDIHVAGPDMPPERLVTIVDQINALNPDLVLIAGDFVSEKRTATHIYTPEEIIAPLAELRATHGVVAVPGNHDHWFDMPGLSSELDKAGITLLANEATSMGPFVIGGLDDDYTGRADLEKTMAAMAPLKGQPILLSHSPDPFPSMTPNSGVMLAGHTHCGQIRYPWGGSPATMSRYGHKYACGRKDENGNTIVTSAGLGTSVLPIRLFSRGDIWLIEAKPTGEGN